MLMIKFYGSSSKGNCLMIEDSESSIMVDCGVKNVEKKINVNKLNGVLISHQHL
jgi:Cft2 family RNA processing exonuclease